jgi:RNA-directed DNA polymerase
MKMASQPKRATKVQTLLARESCLYNVTSHGRLADLIGWAGPHDALRRFSRRTENFNRYYEKRPGKKDRLVEAPAPRIKAMQTAFLAFLKQVKAPSYLQSAIVGRSYLSNSQLHCDAYGCTVTVDIHAFFQSVSRSRVEEMLVSKFRQKRDVAQTLSFLLCCDEHLATGSPASPLVSFWALKDIFDRIDARVSRLGGVFTLYIDDVTITGHGVGHGDIKWLSRIFHGAGLALKQEKSRVYKASAPKVITGRAMRYGTSRAPNAQHKKLVDARQRCSDSPLEAAGYRSLAGTLRHIALLDEGRRTALRDRASDMVRIAERIAPKPVKNAHRRKKQTTGQK